MTPTQRLKAMADDTDLSAEERAACREAVRIIEALPVTADGVPIVPGMKLYIAWHSPGVATDVVHSVSRIARTRGDGWYVSFEDPPRDCASGITDREFDIVFSTATAALAAAAEGGSK